MDRSKAEILNSICYTELVYKRINKKLNSAFSVSAIEKMLFDTIRETPENFFRKIGKNIYVTNHEKNINITINSNTCRVITVDVVEKAKKLIKREQKKQQFLIKKDLISF
jgi:hypothetical protein